VKKAALICAMVLIVSIVPAFALNQTTNNTTAQVQTQSGTCNQTQTHDHNKKCDQTRTHSHNKDQKCQKTGTKCTTCDGDQHKYQYGQKNTANTSKNNQYKYQNGQKNGNLQS
jgi:hypothetical protein